MTGPVNPLEGEVAITFPRADHGYVVGCLTSRAMSWVEQSVGQSVADIWLDVQRRVTVAQGTPDGELPTLAPSMPVGTVAAILWAAIEANRRRTRQPGPEFSIDDGFEIIDAVGIDDAAGYAVALINLSMPFRSQREQIQAQAREAGQDDPFVEMVAAATAAADGTGASSSMPPPAQG